MPSAPQIRVLVVDDSAIVRKVLTSILDAEPDIEVVGAAPDPYIARDKILRLKPDVLTLDIEMPRMDGLTFLDRIMKYHPLPVIMISSLAQSSTRASLEALSRGAVDVLAKPGGPYSVGDLKGDLPRRVRAAANAKLGGLLTGKSENAGTSPVNTPYVENALSGADQLDSKHVPATAFSQSMLVAIGASTGGTTAIERVLSALPDGLPPMVVAQHIPAGFSAAFAERLNRVCAMEVREARNGDQTRPGLVLIAPGNRHMRVHQQAGGWRILLDDGPKVCYQRPSVDVLFRSVAEEAGSRAIGVILTGMGADGAEGLLAMRRAGARTCAQDEDSSVVFGMPREAIERGAAEAVLPISRIGPRLIELCRQGPSSALRSVAV